MRLYTLFFYSAVTVLYWFINMNEKNIIIYIYKRPVCWVELCIQTAGQHIAIINGIHRSRNESAVDKNTWKTTLAGRHHKLSSSWTKCTISLDFKQIRVLDNWMNKSSSYTVESKTTNCGFIIKIL